MKAASSGSQASGQAVVSSLKFGQERLRGEYANSAVFTDGKQVFAVARDEHIDLGFDSTGKDQIVIRIVRQGFGLLGRRLLRSDRYVG
ncbi:MAG: hypothetical protein J0H66_04290 [Solirubrobacterales bacterium]|nr:hypothetical protein [Solirubrobacterales bacterium]